MAESQNQGLLSEPSPQLRRGGTELAVADLQQKMAPSALMYIGPVIQLGLAGACFYIAFAVKPLETCDQPWTMWYKVEGVVTLIQMLLSLALMRGAMAVATNDSVMKAALYAEQKRSEEEMKQAAQAVMDDKAALGGMLAMGAEGCCLCLISVFNFAWIIYAVILDTQNDHCSKMTTCLWWVLGTSAVLNCLAQCAMKKDTPQVSPDQPNP